MAWNEPGGNDNKPRDPWGGGDQGPPDLDEALRKLQAKLGGLFGGGKSGGGKPGGGGGPSAAVSGGMFVILLLVAAVVWALMGLYTVDQQERGVVFKLIATLNMFL